MKKKEKECNHPEHNPPPGDTILDHSSVVYDYTHTCPKCKHKTAVYRSGPLR